MAIYANVGGVQKVVTTPYANVGGVWYSADRVFQRRAGVWELVWPAPATIDLTPTPSDWETVDLSWSVSGVLVDHYEVLRGGQVLVASQPGTTYSDPGRLGGTTYTYTVRGYRDGNIAAEAVEQVTTPARADMGLASDTVTWDSVGLVWTDAEQGSADSYRLRRDGSVIAEGLTAKSYTDAGRNPSTAHTYLLEALRGAVVVGTDTVDVTTPAYPAMSLTATATAYNSVSLSWSPDLNGEADQVVLDRGSTNIYQGANKRSHTDSGRSASTTYEYTVKHRRAGVLLGSAQDSATTPARPTQQLSVTLNAAQSASYTGGGSNRYVGEMYGGYYSSNQGLQKSQAFFAIPDAARKEHGCVSVDSVEISFFTRHHYYNAGGKVRFAPHRNNVPGGFPATFPGAQYPTFGEWSAGKGTWVGGSEWLNIGNLVPTGWAHNMRTEIHSQAAGVSPSTRRTPPTPTTATGTARGSSTGPGYASTTRSTPRRTAMPACDFTTINLCLRAGDKNETTLQVLVDGAPKDLTGAVVTAQARAVSTDASPALTAAVTAVDEAAGIYTVAWDGEDVRTLLGSEAKWSGVWDLNVVEAGDTLATTPCGGKVDAEMDVTRA